MQPEFSITSLSCRKPASAGEGASIAERRASGDQITRGKQRRTIEWNVAIRREATRDNGYVSRLGS
jgi:hypothetical protein